MIGTRFGFQLITEWYCESLEIAIHDELKGGLHFQVGLCCIIWSTRKEIQCLPVNLKGIPQKKNCKKNEHALTSRNAKNLSIPMSGTSFLVQNRDLINHATSPRATQRTKCCSKGISYMLIDWTEKNYPIGTLVIIFQKLPLGDTSQGTPLETEFKKRSWIQRNPLKKPYNTSIS